MKRQTDPALTTRSRTPVRTSIAQQIVVAVCFLAAFSGLADVRTWTGGGAPIGQWSAAANWGGVAPSTFDSLVFDGNTQTQTTNNFSVFAPFNGITFSGGSGAFTLYGNSVVISGATNGSDIGILNNSAAAQTINADLRLNWGLYRFTNAPGGSIALNDITTTFFGGVAWFGPGTVTSATWASEGTGLISILGGAGLFGNSGTGNGFSDLAALSGGTVSAYIYPPSAHFSSNAIIGSTSSSTLTNFELMGTQHSVNSYDLAGGNSSTYISTILVRGNWGGPGGELDIGTNAPGGTLVLGTPIGNQFASPNPYIGGIYYPNPVSNNTEVVRVVPYKLTAGRTTIAGEIIFGVNGTSGTVPPAQEMEVTSAIVNNGSGNAVSVTKTGTGVLSLSPNNFNPSTYTGGTYVNQGYLRAGSSNSFGTGPVYVASGATVSLEAAGGTWANGFFISPGGGTFRSGAGITTGYGSGGQPQTLSGTLTLLGPPITNGPGARIAGSLAGGTMILGGQITGTGTLELLSTAFGTAPIFILSNMTAKANNWTGGLIVNASSNSSSATSVTVKLRANNQLATNSVTMVQSGSGTALLDLNGFNVTIGGLSSLVTTLDVITNSGAACTLTLGANDATADFGGYLAGTINLFKIGNGTQTLSGNYVQNQSGAITLSGGKLVLNGHVGGPIVTLPGTVLAGSGNSSGSCQIGGTVTPGESNSIGRLLTGALTLSNAVLVLDLQNGTNDLIRSGSNLILYGTNAIQPVPVTNNLSSGQQLTIVKYTGTLTGTSNNFVVLPSLPGYSFSLVDPATTPGSINLSIDVVPPKPQPAITNFSLSGTNLVLMGTNAVAGGTYYVLMSTNVAQPLSSWTVMSSNLWGGGASFMFTATNAVSPAVPQRFYILQVR